jgi:Zn-dependent protease with chaperone function
VSATFRAAVSLVALIGFYVLAFSLIAGTIVGAWLLAQYFSLMYWVVGTAAVGGIIFVATLLSAVFSRPQPKPGLDITVGDAPELFAMVTAISEAAGTPGPAQIRLVSEVNAAVSEDSRFLGLIGGHRRMYLGVPLLQGLSVSQLRAVLAHEFGHYSGAHTRLGPIAYRGWNAVVATMRALHGDDVNWLLRVYGWMLRLFAGLYLLMSLAMRRSQEREADRLMVRFAGRANAKAALREIDIVNGYWSFYYEQFLSLGWGRDLAPTADNFFGGFQRLLAARADELADQRGKAPLTEGSYLDTHPPTAERIAAIEAVPEEAVSVPDDDRPGSALVPAFAATAAAAAERCYVFGYRERLDWDELVARVCTMDDQHGANLVYQAAARLAGEPTATLATVVTLSEAGDAAKLVRPVAPDGTAKPFPEVAGEVFAMLVRAAAVSCGVARWRMSWSGPFELVTADGDVLEANSVGALLVDAKTAPEAAARLSALGIDVTAVGEVAAAPAADVGEVVGGFADMKVDGARRDVLVLENGLILAENVGASEQGGWAGLETLVQFGSVTQIAAHHRFVPYASMASAKVSGRFTVKATITLENGAELTLSERLFAERLTENSNEVFKNHLIRAAGKSHRRISA